MLVLDSNKKKLGSRWQEQLQWIPKAVSGRYEHLLVFMHNSRVTMAGQEKMNKDGVALELEEAVEESAALMKLRAVFSAQSRASEIYLPDGRRGSAYVVAGGGGAPVQGAEGRRPSASRRGAG